MRLLLSCWPGLHNVVFGAFHRSEHHTLDWVARNGQFLDEAHAKRSPQEWIDEMAAFVKKLDPNHLVSVGLIGWYGASTPERCAIDTLRVTNDWA